MKNNITKLAFAITAAMAITACGSSGSNSGDNKTQSKPTGPITANNASTYIDLALTALPSLSADPSQFSAPASLVAGMPIGNDNITLAGGQLSTDDNGATILKKLCEDGAGQLIQTFFKPEAFKVTQGEFVREDYEACTLEGFEHDGSVQDIVNVHEEYILMDDSEDPFTDSKTVRVYSYEGYTVKDISSDNNMAIDGELVIEQRVESSESFLDPSKRDTVTFTDITTDLYRITVDVADQPNINYTFTDFAFNADDDTLSINGDVSTINNSREYTYTVATPTALKVTYAEADTVTNTLRAIDSYKGMMVITSGISTLRIELKGDVADLSLDVDNDGEIDHSDTVQLSFNQQ